MESLVGVKINCYISKYIPFTKEFDAATQNIHWKLEFEIQNVMFFEATAY